MAKHKKKHPRLSGVITAVESVSLFLVDDKEVHVGPKTTFSGVVVNPTGLTVGQQVSVVGHKNKHKDFVADKVNVETATGPEPDEPEDPEEDEEQNEPVEPAQPEPEPEPEEEDSSDEESSDDSSS